MDKVTVLSKSYGFEAESYRFCIKLPLMDKVTVLRHQVTVFSNKKTDSTELLPGSVLGIPYKLSGIFQY